MGHATRVRCHASVLLAGGSLAETTPATALPSRGVIVLIDQSGSYRDYFPVALQVIHNEIIEELRPSDCFALLEIRESSFTDDTQILNGVLAALD